MAKLNQKRIKLHVENCDIAFEANTLGQSAFKLLYHTTSGHWCNTHHELRKKTQCHINARANKNFVDTKYFFDKA